MVGGHHRESRFAAKATLIDWPTRAGTSHAAPDEDEIASLNVSADGFRKSFVACWVSTGITNPGLVEQIHRVGKVFYERDRKVGML